MWPTHYIPWQTAISYIQLASHWNKIFGSQVFMYFDIPERSVQAELFIRAIKPWNTQFNLWSNLAKYFIKPTASPFLKPPTWVKENWGISVTLGYTPATRNWPLIRSQSVKCGKIMEVTPGTPDVKSRPMRCWKGLQLQLMCCTPFRLLSQDFGMKRTEYQRLEDQRGDQSCSQSRT